MIKYYVNNPARAYEWGRQHVEAHGGRIYEVSVYGRRHVTVLVSADFLHLLPGHHWSGYCERALGWYFGGGCGWMEDSPQAKDLLDLIEIEPVDWATQGQETGE